MAGTRKKTTTKKITLNDKLYSGIVDYCQLNNIEDVDGFINNCTQQGFNIIKFGFTPKDNVRREKLGIKEPEVETTKEEKVKPETTKKKEEKEVSKRKIRIIKKD